MKQPQYLTTEEHLKRLKQIMSNIESLKTFDMSEVITPEIIENLSKFAETVCKIEQRKQENKEFSDKD